MKFLSIYLFTGVLILSAACVSASNDEHQAAAKIVGIVGLGQMGKAIVECYNSHGVIVHAWNRREERRKEVKDLNLKHVTVHDSLEDLLASTDLIIMTIVGGDGLSNAEALILSVDPSLWKDKTIIQYSAHEPLAAKRHQQFIEGLGAHLIAGAMIAEPKDVCKPDDGIYFVATQEPKVLENATPILELLGPLEVFLDDVGLASLSDFGVLESTYFGITGFELTYLMAEHYGTSPEYRERLFNLCSKWVPLWFPAFTKGKYHVMSTKRWTECVDNKEMAMDVMHIHLQFCKKMGVSDGLYLENYIRHLERISDSKSDIARWTEYAISADADGNEL